MAGINLTSQFSEQAALPLDDRLQFATTTARDALVSGRRYAGLRCFVIADQKEYVLQNDLVTWKDGSVGVEHLGDIPDVTLTDPGADEVLTYDGAKWVNAPGVGGSWIKITYGNGNPTMLLNPPQYALQFYYDVGKIALGFVPLWVYSTVLGNWYPFQNHAIAKHLTEFLGITEALAKMRHRPVDETMEVIENLIKKRLRPENEGLLISENLVLLIISGAQSEINGSVINGVAI